MAGKVCCGKPGLGAVRQVKEWQVRYGEDWHGNDWCGMPGLVLLGEVRHGGMWLGTEGTVRSGMAGMFGSVVVRWAAAG